VLIPTTDDLAWLIALHRGLLAQWFQLYAPSIDAVYGVLNKKRLDATCRASGLEVPRTWFPESEADLARIAGEARFPVLVKPQTQILFASHTKGLRADDGAELTARFREFLARNHYGQALLEFDPGAEVPMIQEMHAEAATGIYSLSGFVDPTAELFVARAAVKVLQRPRKLGIGLCFEEAPVRPELAAKVAQLCQRLGYFGVFEVEFIAAGERMLALDFNPRLYSQMAFDIDRGVPLPLLVYLGAIGDEAGLRAQIEQARQVLDGGDRVYCHRFVLEVMLRGQKLSGRISATEASTWRRWWTDHHSRATATDAVADRQDSLPALVDAALHLYGYARHPRAFVRSMVLDQ
jgi:predicted ATP-grasp superfamily ATP-dependent carboligase